MKWLLRAVCAALFALLLLTPAHAAEWDELGRIIGAEAVEEAADGADPALRLAVGEDYGAALQRIVGESLAAAGSGVRAPLRAAVLLLLSAGLVSLFSALGTGDLSPDPAQIAGVLAAAAITAGNMQTCLGLGQRLLERIGDFSKVLLPTLSTAAAFGGALSSAAAKYAAAALFMDLILTLAQRVLLPLIWAYLAAVLAWAVFEGDGLAAAVSFLKWLGGSLLLVLSLAFVVYLSVTGLAAGSVDAAALRVTKTGISTALPVVGGIVSDAAASLLAGAALVRTTVGVFGLLAVLAFCLGPFLTLGLHYLLFKAASALAAPLAGGKLAKAVGGFVSAFGLLLGTVGLSALGLFFSVYSLMRTVT